MQARGATLAPGILFDSDMGRNIDAALALAMLHGLGRGRVIAVGISNSSLDAAAFCDAVSRFYGGGGSLPVGLAEDGSKLDNAPMLSVPLGMRGSEGQPVFRHAVRNINDTADPSVVFRNALLTQQDQQGIAVLVDGFICSVAALVAVRLNPSCRPWLLFGHRGAEPGHRHVLETLHAQPLLDLGLRLGEGSGAALAVPLLRLACDLHGQMATFAEAAVADRPA